MEADDHLQERQLEMIRSWPDSDHPGLMEYVESLWQAGEWGWKAAEEPIYRAGCFQDLPGFDRRLVWERGHHRRVRGQPSLLGAELGFLSRWRALRVQSKDGRA